MRAVTCRMSELYQKWRNHLEVSLTEVGKFALKFASMAAKSSDLQNCSALGRSGNGSEEKADKCHLAYASVQPEIT